MTTKQVRKLWSKVEAGTATMMERMALALAEIAHERGVTPGLAVKSIFHLPIARVMWEADARDLGK